MTVGPARALERTTLEASRSELDCRGTPPAAGTRVTAQIRHRHREAAATLEPRTDDTVHVTFDEPQHAVAPGQAVVFYEGQVVLGGGWID